MTQNQPVLPEGTKITEPVRPEGLDPDFAQAVETCTELGLYLTINALAALMSSMARDLPTQEVRRSPMMIQEIAEAGMQTQVRVSYAIHQTARFGVTPFEPGEHRASEEYERWLNWWHQYVTSLSQEEWGELDAAHTADLDVSKWRPAGDWRPPPIEDGILPAKWLVREINPAALRKKASGWSSEKKEMLERLLRCQTKDETLWFFRSVPVEIDLQGNYPREGYCLVRKRKPFAALTTKTLTDADLRTSIPGPHGQGNKDKS